MASKRRTPLPPLPPLHKHPDHPHDVPWTWAHRVLGFLLPPYLSSVDRHVLWLLAARYECTGVEALVGASEGTLTAPKVEASLRELDLKGLVKVRPASGGGHRPGQNAPPTYTISGPGFAAVRRLPPP